MREGYQLQLQLCKAFQKRSRNLQYHPSAKGGYEQLPGADTLWSALIVFVCAKLKEGWQVFANLPGWCWARIKQLALIGSSSSLHSEACKALGGSDGVVHSTISHAAICMRAVAKPNDCRAMPTKKYYIFQKARLLPPTTSWRELRLSVTRVGASW